jgi:aromatic ring-opening dioxygenase catalytic subunit (LigB family)
LTNQESGTLFEGKTMSIDSQPPLFVSHGPPTLPLENVPAREFLTSLGDRYRNAQAVLCISAHWNTSRPTVNAEGLLYAVSHKT